MADEQTQTTIHWSCNVCGTTEGVENGICPTCGPTQTTPISDSAKEEAGVAEAAGEKKQEEETEAKEVVEPTSTEK
ncbi:MAG: hypothetical protein ACREHC_08835 [Candidatus Levyibacteriota bacterium]